MGSYDRPPSGRRARGGWPGAVAAVTRTPPGQALDDSVLEGTKYGMTLLHPEMGTELQPIVCDDTVGATTTFKTVTRVIASTVDNGANGYQMIAEVNAWPTYKITYVTAFTGGGASGFGTNNDAAITPIGANYRYVRPVACSVICSMPEPAMDVNGTWWAGNLTHYDMTGTSINAVNTLKSFARGNITPDKGGAWRMIWIPTQDEDYAFQIPSYNRSAPDTCIFIAVQSSGAMRIQFEVHSVYQAIPIPSAQQMFNLRNRVGDASAAARATDAALSTLNQEPEVVTQPDNASTNVVKDVMSLAKGVVGGAAKAAKTLAKDVLSDVPVVGGALGAAVGAVGSLFGMKYADAEYHLHLLLHTQPHQLKALAQWEEDHGLETKLSTMLGTWLGQVALRAERPPNGRLPREFLLIRRGGRLVRHDLVPGPPVDPLIAEWEAQEKPTEELKSAWVAVPYDAPPIVSDPPEFGKGDASKPAATGTIAVGPNDAFSIFYWDVTKPQSPLYVAYPQILGERQTVYGATVAALTANVDALIESAKGGASAVRLRSAILSGEQGWYRRR